MFEGICFDLQVSDMVIATSLSHPSSNPVAQIRVLRPGSIYLKLTCSWAVVSGWRPGSAAGFSHPE